MTGGAADTSRKTYRARSSRARSWPLTTSPPPSPRSWYLTISAAYLGLFVWAPFFDQLWAGDLPRLDLPLHFAAVAAASIVCFGLFYMAASWGLAARQPLGVVASSTFGSLGSEWITAIAPAAASVVWYAVAIDFAVDSTLLGLSASGLIAPGDLARRHLGAFELKSPVYFCTALFWIYITGTAGLLKLAGVIVALMRIYAPVALLLLTAVALWMLPGLPSYRLDRAVAIASEVKVARVWSTQDPAWQIILGFFAMASLSSVDWGSQARGRRDLVLGGLTGIVLATSCVASMSLIVVAGSVGRTLEQGIPTAAGMVEPLRLSFRWAVIHGIGGAPAGVILVLFGLAALAPACYSVRLFGETLAIRWPRPRQFGWTWIGGAIALLLAATSTLNRLDLVWRAMGDAFAPAVGAMAGDWLRQRGRWPGPRPGICTAGVMAWSAGVVAALALEATRAESAGFTRSMPPSSICGFVTSCLLFALLVRPGAKRADLAKSENETRT
jgi:hypothetical protein